MAKGKKDDVRGLAFSGPAFTLLGAKITKTFEGHRGYWIESVSFSPHGRYALSACSSIYDAPYYTLKVWDILSGDCQRTLEGHRDSVNSAVFSPDGRYILSGSSDETLKLWDVSTGECLKTFEGHKNGVSLVCLSADGRYILSKAHETIMFWDIRTGECLRTIRWKYRSSPNSLSSVSFSLDCRYTLLVDHKNLKVWDISINESLRTLEGHQDIVSSAVFSPDGRYILSGSEDKTLKLWNVSTGECLKTFEGHKNGVSSVCLSADGRWALSGSSDETLKLWDVSTAECLWTFEGDKATGGCVSFSPDGCFALSGNRDKTINLIEFNWEFERKATVDWDDGAEPFLHNFLTSHQTVTENNPLIRSGEPKWKEKDFQELMYELNCRGYGWLHHYGVREKLDEMKRKRCSFIRRVRSRFFGK